MSTIDEGARTVTPESLTPDPLTVDELEQALDGVELPAKQQPEVGHGDSAPGKVTQEKTVSSPHGWGNPDGVGPNA